MDKAIKKVIIEWQDARLAVCDHYNYKKSLPPIGDTETLKKWISLSRAEDKLRVITLELEKDK